MSNVSHCTAIQQSNLTFKYNVVCFNVKGRIVTLFFWQPKYAHGKQIFLHNSEGMMSVWKPGIR